MKRMVKIITKKKAIEILEEKLGGAGFENLRYCSRSHDVAVQVGHKILVVSSCHPIREGWAMHEFKRSRYGATRAANKAIFYKKSG